MSVHCTHHCRHCGEHFTSLKAFDGHQPAGSCIRDPAEHGMVPRVGSCKIAGPEITRVCTVYEHPDAERIRDHFKSDTAA